MQSQIEIRNTARGCEIDIEGTIGVPEAWQFDDPGARVATYEKFRDTSVASVNLSGQPVGFYFAVFFGKSGKPYSVKLFR